MTAGIAAIDDNDYYMDHCKTIAKTRDEIQQKLRELGFVCTDSMMMFSESIIG